MLPSAHVNRVGVRIVSFRGSMATPPILLITVKFLQRSVEEPSAAMLFEAVEGADLRRLLLSNSTHEGALRCVAALQGGRANTARMVRCVA
jgi:hypothetical protein